MYMYVHHRPTDTEIPITNRYSVRTCILHNIIRTHVRASRGMHINVYIPLLVYPELGSTVMLPLHQVHELIIRIRGLNTTVITGHHAQTHVHTHTHIQTHTHTNTCTVQARCTCNVTCECKNHEALEFDHSNSHVW